MKLIKTNISDSKIKLNKLTKKLERRQKQRITNVVRAKEMHAARIKLNSSTKQKKIILPKINVGCSGWFYWHWRDKFYPPALTTQQWFQYYRKRFSTVELNAPFYSWPTIATVKNWVKQTESANFIYTIKVSEMITHVKKFVRTKNLINDFYFIDSILKKSMGCFLFQFPPSYKYTPLKLKSILQQLNPKYRNVVEFRHNSWWNAHVYEQFKLHKIIFCSCSSPNLPDDLIATTEEVYIRFHGLSKWYRHDYSKEELKNWVDKIVANKPKRVWAYFNNDNEGYAIKNSKEFIRQLKKFF
jgi:uncharacterized protein YecE (DUF72 family)